MNGTLCAVCHTKAFDAGHATFFTLARFETLKHRYPVKQVVVSEKGCIRLKESRTAGDPITDIATLSSIFPRVLVYFCLSFFFFCIVLLLSLC